MLIPFRSGSVEIKYGKETRKGWWIILFKYGFTFWILNITNPEIKWLLYLNWIVTLWFIVPLGHHSSMDPVYKWFLLSFIFYFRFLFCLAFLLFGTSVQQFSWMKVIRSFPFLWVECKQLLIRFQSSLLMEIIRTRKHCIITAFD